jgi:hypothetical protein
VFATTVSAQQLLPPAPGEAAIKLQVQTFETVLRFAVMSAGSEIAKKARIVVPGIELQYVSDVEINGWWTPDFGYTFDVTIPEILPTSVFLFTSVQKLPATRGSQVVPTAGAGGVSATSTVPTPDSMIKDPVVPFDPIAEYSNISRQALIDVIVDNSGGIQFKPSEKLQVVAGPGPQYVPNPLSTQSRKLILTVNGEDLLAFRKGELKREDLIAKIQERRF